MYCNLTELARTNGTLCRSFTCVPCREVKDAQLESQAVVEKIETQRVVEIPPEFSEEPLKSAYIQAYELVRKNAILKEMSAVRRISWIQGFVNGVLYTRAEVQSALKDMKK